jgi:uncharacterized protein (TIGR03437 family)
MKTKSSLLRFVLLCALACLGSFSPAYGQQSYPPADTIIYRDLDGHVLTLQAFTGRKVKYALPDSWLDPTGAQGLTSAELVSLINQTDSLYEQLTQFVGSEPQGDGQMIIAIVPITGVEGGAAGEALLGRKVCEIGQSQLTETKLALANNRLPNTVIHEMDHTFDVYRNYLGYYPDSSHSWTEFWIPYSQYVLHLGDYSTVPELALQEKAFSFTQAWDRRGNVSSWEVCVKTGAGCDGVSANRFYAGLLMRYAKLHGQEAVKRVFAFYQTYKASHDPLEIFSFTPEQKNDLLAEALSYGANLNVSSELDTWFWPVSQAERSKLAEMYPQANPNTQDLDGDGWTAARGDFDDHDATVYPGAPEVVNGRDDDCNGVIDDVRRTAGPTLFTPPAKLVGHLLPGQAETYHFTAAGTLVIRLRQPTGAWVGFVGIKREGTVTDSFQFGMSSTQPTLYNFSLPDAGPWQLEVHSMTGTEGDYEIVVAFPPAPAGTAGEVLALPLRAQNSLRAHTLAPGGLARAIVTLPGVDAAEASARADAQGNWPQSLSGFNVLVGGQPSTILAVRHSGNAYTIDFVVSPQVTADARAPVTVRHASSGAQWSTTTELLARAPALWGQAGTGQTSPAALALESPTLLAFDESRRAPADGNTRVMLFASGLGSTPNANSPQLIAQLDDGRRVILPVEYAGPMANFPGVQQLIFRLDNSLNGQTQLLLTLEGEESWVTLPLR